MNKSLDTETTKWYFLSFSAGSFQLRRAGKRIRREAKNSRLFEKTIVFNEKKLKRFYPDFWLQHSRFISSNPRGFGHWLWKPFLIHEILKTLPAGSGLVYLDAGCHLNLESIASRLRFQDYKNLTVKHNSLTMQTFDGEFNITDLSETAWSRKMVTDYYNLTLHELKSGQIQAGIIFLINNEENIKLIEEWFQGCCLDDYSFLSEASTFEQNYSSFNSHRHDQAIFSAIAKKNQMFSIKDETFWAPNWDISGKDYPIWATRNKSGINFRFSNRHDLMDRLHSFLSSQLGSSQFLKKLIKPFKSKD